MNVLIFWQHENCLFSKKTLLTLAVSLHHFWHHLRPPERGKLVLGNPGDHWPWFVSIPNGFLVCLFLYSVLLRVPFYSISSRQSLLRHQWVKVLQCQFELQPAVCSQSGAQCPVGGLIMCQRGKYHQQQQKNGAQTP